MTKPIDDTFVWTSIKKHPITMFTTEEGGRLVSRPMAGYARPEEGCIYFLTRVESDKTRAVDADPQVNLAYADVENNTYISVAGTARTSQDRAKIHELWSTQAEAWLPEGPDAPETGLITVTPADAVVWDSTSSRIVYAAKTLTAIVTQSPPDAGRVGKVSL